MIKQVHWCYVFLTLRVSLIKITSMNLTNFPCFYPSFLATETKFLLFISYFGGIFLVFIPHFWQLKTHKISFF